MSQKPVILEPILHNGLAKNDPHPVTSTERTAVVISRHGAAEIPIEQLSICRILADLLLVLLCGAPSMFLLLFGKPHIQGYFCNDHSLMYPQVVNLLPTAKIAIIGFILAFIVMTICELSRAFYLESGRRTHPVLFREVNYRIGHTSIHRVVVRLYKFFGYFILGAGLSMMLVDVSKYTSGRLRPHFFDVCRPKPIGVPECGPDETNRWIAEYECMGSASTSEHDIKETHLSFYSGHSSFAFFTAMYLALYFQGRIRSCGIVYSPILLPIIQFMCFVIAMYSAILNVTENEHHWTDVLVGSIMGNLIAVIMCVYIVKLFSDKKYESVSIGGRSGSDAINLLPVHHANAVGSENI